jgi:hypothetical protein
MDDAVWETSVFSKNRERLIASEAIWRIFRLVLFL